MEEDQVLQSLVGEVRPAEKGCKKEPMLLVDLRLSLLCPMLIMISSNIPA